MIFARYPKLSHFPVQVQIQFCKWRCSLIRLGSGADTRPLLSHCRHSSVPGDYLDGGPPFPTRLPACLDLGLGSPTQICTLLGLQATPSLASCFESPSARKITQRRREQEVTKSRLITVICRGRKKLFPNFKVAISMRDARTDSGCGCGG